MTHEAGFPKLDVNKTYLTRALAGYSTHRVITCDTQPGGHPSVVMEVDPTKEVAPEVEQFDHRPDDN